VVNLIKKNVAIGIFIILFMSSFISIINANILEQNDELNHLDNEDLLDIKYIKSIAENLSNIVFTEYNESAGELAKGRFFGTKGEHRAAEILFENMSKLGLWTKKEKIENTPSFPELTHFIQTHDYGLKVNNVTIKPWEFHIVPSKLGPRDNPELIDYNFSYECLKVIEMPDNLRPWAFFRKFSDIKEDFVFITETANFIPESESPLERLIYKHINHVRYIGIPSLIKNFFTNIKKDCRYNLLPHWKGTIGYDLNNDTYNMGALQRHQPLIYINGSLGDKIRNDLKNVTIDYHINQSYNDSVVSYNVIGQLNGSDPSKTVLVDCLYDSWWCQGTADSAIGMAMVMGVAKYFVDHNITPKYNIKFVAFGGEEAGLRGAYSYEYVHRDENIIYVFDLNQLGFKQIDPKLDLTLIGSKLPFLFKVWNIAKNTDYVKKVDNTAGIEPLWMPIGTPSDDRPFAMSIFRPCCKTVCFIKLYYWVLHHRDGQKHKEGDVMKYFYNDDVNATGEIVIKVIKNFCA